MNPDANPLLAPWTGPHGLPPFASLRADHWLPALRSAAAAHRADLDAIAADPSEPDFANTALAFDLAGAQWKRLSPLLQNLVAAETSPELQAVEREAMPLVAAHEAAVAQHAGVFARLERVHGDRQALGDEERRLVERLHLDFCLAGARLAPAARERALAIAAELAGLHTAFAQNVLADEAEFTIALEQEDLDGLPVAMHGALRQAAVERGAPGWRLTLSRSHVMPFLAQSPRRDLRERVWRAWISRGQLAAARDNAANIRAILALRRELAALHGHACFAEFALVDTMARSTSAVEALLLRAWQPAVAKALRDRDVLAALARDAGQQQPLAPWDWRYFAERLRADRHAVDDATVKPYFALERMTEAMFDCARRLFGLHFSPLPDVLAYHPDVVVHEVRDGAGDVIGVFLADNFARPTKRGGAWMNEYRCQSRAAGSVIPIVGNHNNFTRPAPGEPCLLSLDDVRTLFHEFGHGLHGLLSSVTYDRLAGTRVLRDFVELPSQLFEHWATEPLVLARHARHVVTGEPIPPELVDRVNAARKVSQGLETVEYLASALVDQALHRAAADIDDLDAFERGELARLGMPAEIVPRHRLPHFLHLFSGPEYAAAYYVYIWAEVLDADAFEAFREAGDPFDPAVADRLRRFVYAAGNRFEPGAAFRAFRGRDPDIGAMIAKRGLGDSPAPA